MKQKGFAPIIILVLITLTVVGYFGYKNYWPKISALISPQSYEECTKAYGSRLLNMFPGVCVTRSGKSFTQSVTPEQEMFPCSPGYTVERDTPELTASQNYATECFSKINKDDCLSVDLYNTKAGDFTSPDGISDCLWSNQNGEGKFCGGIAANLPENKCPDGFFCKLDGNNPDASGHCIKE